MIKVIVASTNPVKIETTKLSFESVFGAGEIDAEGVIAESGVSDQPLTDEETLRGAMNRIKHAQELKPEADFWIGLEGGVEDVDGEMYQFAWMVIRDKNGKTGKAKTATFMAPPIYRKKVLEGMEIGHISDEVFGVTNSKHQMGVSGLLTNGIIDRKELYRHAIVFALIPFIQKGLFEKI